MKTFTDHDQIRRKVKERVEAERAEYEHPDPDAGQQTSSNVSGADVLKALKANEDGDARLYIKLHRDRFVFDHAAGRWFVWAGHYWKEDILGEALQAIEAVIEVYGREFLRQARMRLKAAKSDKEK